MGEGWNTPIDAYCERVDPSFWAEPANALTNFAFLLAAGIACRAARREGHLDSAIGLLVALTVAIGIGSFLFHTVAARWAALADTLPITLFILSYFVLIMRRGFGLAWPWSLALGLAFLPSSAAIQAIARALAGGLFGSSTGYLPALLALVVCGGLLAGQGRPGGRGLLAGATLFAVSLTFRTLDRPLCDLFPLGTHFVWHVLNGLLLGWLVYVMVRLRRA